MVTLSLLGKKHRRTFESIVAPLKTIESDLSSYIGEQEDKVLSLNEDRKKIDDDIQEATVEKAKSIHTVNKIAQLLGSDFQETVAEDAKD